METINLKAYESYTNSDKTEGRGHDVHIGYFVNIDDAILASKGNGVMGIDAGVRPVDKNFFIYNSIDEFNSHKEVLSIKNSLDKLSKKERDAILNNSANLKNLYYSIK